MADMNRGDVTFRRIPYTRGWVRTHPTADGGRETVHCAGPDDVTPVAWWHIDQGTVPYDPRCAPCWLGRGHTVALHTQRIAAVTADLDRLAARKG